MFGDIMARIQNEFVPAAKHVGNQMDRYACRIIALLEDIRDSIENEEFLERRQRYSFTLAADGTYEIEVPANEQWRLDAVTLSAATDSQLIVRQAGWLTYGYTSLASNVGTAAALGIPVQPGNLEVTVDADSEVMLLFKIEVPEKSKRAHDRGAHDRVFTGLTIPATERAFAVGTDGQSQLGS